MPGTDLAGDEGYSSVWYFYCPKRYKNTQGKPSGHRQRAIAGGDACWHSETRPKPVKGLVAGATLCNLSYGRKEGSSRSCNRLGWCMTEYDEEAGDDGHVLCKVYRSSSSLAKGKLKASSSTSTNPTLSEQAAAQCSSASKRKATADHPQARPSKISHAQACASNYSFVDQEFYHQMQEPLFTDDQMGMTMPVCVDYESLFPAEEEQDTLVTGEQLLQNTLALVAAEEEQSQQNTLVSAEEEQLQQNTLAIAEEQLRQNTPFTMDGLLGGPGYGEYGGCSWSTQVTMDELFSRSSGCYGTPTAMASPDAGFFEGLAF